jgi:hypothetical protein
MAGSLALPRRVEQRAWNNPGAAGFFVLAEKRQGFSQWIKSEYNQSVNFDGEFGKVELCGKRAYCHDCQPRMA